MIHVLTPIRAGESLAYDITQQSVKCKRFTHCSDAPEERRENEATNREALKEFATDPYTILMDADVVLDSNDAFEKMIAFMKKHPFPAAVVDTKGRAPDQLCHASESGHAVIALTIIRADVLRTITFAPLYVKYNHEDLINDAYLWFPPESQGCLCVSVNRQIRQMYGWPIPYIRGVTAHEKKKGV